MEKTFKERYAEQYWKDVEREELDMMDKQFAIDTGDTCGYFSRKGCIGCPDQKRCEMIS